jgi:hypothetical protein
MATLTPPSPDTATGGWAAFDKTTSRWGPITMIVGMIVMILGPGLLALQLGVQPGAVITGVLAITATFGVVWFVEPLSYFPLLGPASMYQAFMIGNISNKLLPAAIVAQSAVNAKPETKRGQLASVLAICGAAAVHLTTLAVAVGLFGTLLISIIPPELINTVQTYVLPAVLGSVLVQMVWANPQPRILIIAAVVGAIVVFVLTPLFPAVSYFAVALGVIATITLSLTLPGRAKTSEEPVATTLE